MGFDKLIKTILLKIAVGGCIDGYISKNVPINSRVGQNNAVIKANDGNFSDLIIYHDNFNPRIVHLKDDAVHFLYDYSGNLSNSCVVTMEGNDTAWVRVPSYNWIANNVTESEGFAKFDIPNDLVPDAKIYLQASKDILSSLIAIDPEIKRAASIGLQHSPWNFSLDEGFLAFVPPQSISKENVFFVRYESEIKWRPNPYDNETGKLQETSVLGSDLYADMAAILMPHRILKTYKPSNPEVYRLEGILERAFEAACRKYNL